MNLESLPKFFSPKSMHITDTPRATASDSLSITDVMASLGLAGHQAKPGIDLFLAKQGISKPDRAVEYLYQYALSQAGKYKAVDKLDDDIKLPVLQLLANFAYQDYARSAASVRTCGCCKGKGFIDAQVFTNKVQYPDGKPPKWAGCTKGVYPSYWEEIKAIRETVRVLCHECKGKGVISNSCRCHGRGKVIDKEQSEIQGVPVMKMCGKCSGRGYSRIAGETVRKAISGAFFELAETTWRRDYKPFYETLVTQCHKEESDADIIIRKITQ
ncbi:antitermination protein [Sodalis endosymbiont of Spalangia cameroni]|uniref:antitermination protein n=1 Tax=Sodalis praecaptivus TaxID=1239307 RepID=UPI0031F86C6F